MSETGPTRRIGWVRIGLFVLLGGVCAAIGEYGIAALFAVVAATLAWIDRKPAARGDS